MRTAMFNDDALTHTFNPNLLAVEKFDFLYTDPPWGQGMIKWFNRLTEPGKKNKELNFDSFLIHFLTNISSFIKGELVIEMGNNWTPQVINALRLCDYTVHEVITQKYNKGTSKAVYANRQSLPSFNFSDAYMKGGQKAVLAILEIVKPRNIVDPFMGVGRNYKACKKLNVDYYGVELSKERFKKSYSLWRT